MITRSDVDMMRELTIVRLAAKVLNSLSVKRTVPAYAAFAVLREVEGEIASLYLGRPIEECLGLVVSAPWVNQVNKVRYEAAEWLRSLAGRLEKPLGERD